MRRRTEFKRIWHQVNRDISFASLAKLSRMTSSRNPDVRLQSLFKMRRQIDGNPSKGYFTLAKRLIEDSDNDCRWQALIVIGEYIPTDPTKVWLVVSKYSKSEDDDMRMGVATVLLEHLLEYHFDKFFPKVRKEALQVPVFADTLSHCHAFGQAKRNWGKVKKLLKQVRA